jgi:predicted O-methyltransferase YrrM
MKMKTNIASRAIEILKKEGLVALLRGALAYLKLWFLILPDASVKLNKTNFDSLDDLVDFCFHGIRELIKPQQSRVEIMELLKNLNRRKPKVLIEIGTAAGGTLFLFCRVAAENATIISIDFPDARFGGGYPWWRIPLYKGFRLPKQKLHLIRADSHNIKTLEKVKHILADRKADFIFIDGDHSYEGVKKDFEMFSPLVKQDGMITFHDIVVHPAETGCEVNRFWNDLGHDRYIKREIVLDENQGQCGIGILEFKSK